MLLAGLPHFLPIAAALVVDTPPAKPWALPLLLFTLAAAILALLGWNLRQRQELRARRAEEEALKRSLEGFRKLLDGVPFPMAVGEIGNGRLLYANTQVAQALGLPLEELLTHTSLDFWARAEDRDEVLRLLAEHGFVRNLEREFRNQHGESIWVLVSASILPFGGRPAIYMAFADITDRRHALEAMQESEERWRTLFEASPIPISLAKDGLFVYVNPAYLRMLGCERAEDLVGVPVLDHIAPESRELLKERSLRRGMGETIPSRYECAGFRKDGTRFPYDITVSTIRLKDGPMTLAFVEDITERKRFEESLRSSESRFREIADDLPVAMATVLPDGRVEFLNRRFTRLFGYELADIPTEGTWFEKAYPEPDTRAAILEVGALMRKEALESGRPVGPVEFGVRCRDGSTRDVEFHYVDLRQRSLWTLQDVTQRNRIQESLRQAQKMESLGLMAGGIAHDFNNLLQAILGNLEMAERLLGEPARARVALERAEQMVHSASELSGRMLDFSGRTFLDLRALDLGALLAEVRPSLEAKASRLPHALLLWDVGPEVPRILGDHSRLLQVLEILATNALEALPPGGGTVRIGVRSVRGHAPQLQGFWMEPLPEDAAACLTVSDEGVGIPPKVMERIFDPFFTTREPGRGLGLSAALGILRAHKAGLQIQSLPGEGSTFRVYLKAAQAPELRPEGAAPRPERPASLRPTAILVADDEEVLRETMAEYLRDILGHPVYEARDGQEALELFEAHSDEIALVLMDATMPRLKGGEAFDAIRRIRPEITGYLCSGFSEDMGQEAVLRHGFKGFLKKPFTLSQLESLVQGSLVDPD